MEEKIKKLLFSCDPINIELAFTISKKTEEIALKEFKELINFIESKSLNIKYSNKIKYFIKKAIKNLILRKCITFGNTNIKKLPNNIGILKNLEILSIPYNELTELPDSFENLQSLFKLNLCYNNFIKFPKVLFKLKKLNYLHLDGNNISEKEILKFSSKFPECIVTFDDKYGNNCIL
jgi:Leucine-rich repeat (LRR) protein